MTEDSGGKKSKRLTKQDMMAKGLASRSDAINQAREAAESGADVVAGYGGDGTQMEVVTGVMGTGVPMAVLPGGTGNIFPIEVDPPQPVVGDGESWGDTPITARVLPSAVSVITPVE